MLHLGNSEKTMTHDRVHEKLYIMQSACVAHEKNAKRTEEAGIRIVLEHIRLTSDVANLRAVIHSSISLRLSAHKTRLRIGVIT